LGNRNCAHSAYSGVKEQGVQTVVSLLVVHGDAIERVLDQRAIAREALQQASRVVISHHRNFIGRL
jgi:hypothetical protein